MKDKEKRGKPTVNQNQSEVQKPITDEKPITIDKQKSKKMGYHGNDDEKELNPEE
jgi:hypothetical protein